MSPQPPVMFLFLTIVLSIFAICFGQLNQGIRLAESPLGSHAGRVEVKYNGRWGTICDNGWSSFDSFTVCKMLNFTDDICAIRGETDVFGQGTGDVWITNLACGYNQTHLDDCRNSIPQTTNPCEHTQDAAIICQDNTVMPIPYNITQLNQTSRTVIIKWNLAFIPPLIRGIDFRLNVSQNGSTTYRSIFYHTAVTNNSRDFQYTITGLTLNQTYTIDIRAEGEYEWCSYNELIGNKSAKFNIKTSETIPLSTLPMRLLKFDSVSTPHIGRLQVEHNGQWGSVCNDYFGIEEADVACMGLNYTAGAICYAINTFPVSTGPILLDDVDCSNADRFQDCTHRGWGVHNCDSFENIGLICDPGPIALPTVTGLRVAAVSPSSITVEWNSASNIARYRIEYGPIGGSTSLAYVLSSVAKYTLSRLILGLNYSISISAAKSYREYTGGNCYSQYHYGEYSEPVYEITRESAPTVTVRNFHITILNSTTVQATWSLSLYTTGLNGNVRGYKLYVDRINGNQTIIDIQGEINRAYIVTRLEPTATYLFSIVIYTVADGPHSVRLQVTLPDPDVIPLISKFGVYGNNIEALTAYTSTRGFNVLCGSDVKDATFEWRFANGSRIGASNPGFRGAHFINGTAVLQIGTGLPYVRTLTLCDGGLYTCVATPSSGEAITRNFSLLVGFSQPILDTPRLVEKGSTWVQIIWDPLDCDGGFLLNNYNVEYRQSGIYSYMTVDSVTSLNYTFKDLTPSISYDFRVVRVSSVSTRLSYSPSISVITKESGPSPPRDIQAVVGYNSEVCLIWKPPALPVGVVILYNVYAELVETSTDPIDSIDLPTDTVVKTFPGTPTEGCMSLEVTGVIYHIQMSAVAIVNGERLEGTLSSITGESTVYVPPPGIPSPVDLVSSATNTSVTLEWSLPENVQSSYTFNVSYSGTVEWTSDTGVFISFKEQGQETTDNTSITVFPLTPSTKYDFTVAAITTEGELGDVVSVTVTTNREYGDKLAYFQIRIQNIDNCEEWQNKGTKSKLSEIKQSLQLILTTQCQCEITTSHITQSEFSCHTGPSNTITYRARISGTDTQSASDLASLLRAWVESGEASIRVGTSRLHLDPTCDATLANIHAPDCKVDDTITPKPTQVTDKEPTVDDGNNENGASSAEVAGILLGGLIAGLLLALLFTFIIIIYIWIYKRKKESFKDQSAFRELVDVPGNNDVGVSNDDDAKF